MGYADLDRCKVLLELDDDDPEDAEKILFLGEVDGQISAVFEIKIGRRFSGTAGTDAAISVNGSVDGSDILILEHPIRSVSAIEFVGDAPETIDVADVQLWHMGRFGDAYSLRWTNGRSWPRLASNTQIKITGQWSLDSIVGPVPAEVTGAVTFIVCEEFKLRYASPEGLIGDDGLAIRPRNPWTYEIVKEAIARHKVRQVAFF